jgi:hypothetical protein
VPPRPVTWAFDGNRYTWGMYIEVVR